MKNFHTVHKYHVVPTKSKAKMKRRLMNQIIEQLKNCDKVIAFRDFNDERTEQIIKKSRKLKIPVIEVRI